MTSRWMPTLVLVASSLFVNWAHAQDESERPRSLSYRLAELRRSWSSDVSAEVELSPQQSVPTTSVDESGRGYLAIAAESMRNSLPRVNPRNLLGPSTATQATESEPTSISNHSYANGSTTGGSRTRPGSRSGRYTATNDVAVDLGATPRVAMRTDAVVRTPQSQPTATATQQGPFAQQGPFGIVPTPGSERVGSILGGLTAPSASATPSAEEGEAIMQKRRELAAAQLRRDMIGSGADSRATTGFGFSDTTKPVATNGYRSAAEAAQMASPPDTATVQAATTTTAKPLGPATIGITPLAAQQYAALGAIEIAAVEATAATLPSEPLAVEPNESNYDSSNARQAFAMAAPSPSDVSVAPQPATTTPEPTIATGTMLASTNLPLLATSVAGPRQIMVGHESTFTVRLENRGRGVADEVMTTISIPAWANVVRSNPTAGVLVPTAGGIEWQLDRLAGQSQQSIELGLIPTAARAIELGVAARHKPVGTTTLVEVQEAKIEMVVSGPDEVFFGRAQTYRLTISNPGTGAATNIAIGVIPPGQTTATGSYRIERLSPGETKNVDFDMISREAGQIAVRATAEADGGLMAAAEQSVFCRKAELELDWRGPDRKYAGNPATYYFRIRNPGTAAAERTTLSIALPPGFEMQGFSEGAQHDAPGRRVVWTIGAVEPNGERFFELTGIVNEPGSNKFEMTAATESNEAVDRKTGTTEVVAIADLKLQIADPKGPIPVGREVEYEITVTNRGRSAADNIEIVALFSAGIEPLGVEGATATIANGRVGFPALPVMPPGATTKFRIKAKSLTAGTHLFRAEVLCSELDIKLAAEESTQFYVDDNPTLSSSQDDSKDESAAPSMSLGRRYSPSW